MGQTISTPRPWWFWAIIAVCMIWSLIGCAGYLVEQLLPIDLYAETFGVELTGLREITPVWATAGYATGVWFGISGLVLLMMRKRLAIAFLWLSLIGALIGFIPYATDYRFYEAMTEFDVGMAVFVIGQAVFILWFARHMLRPDKGGSIGDQFS